MDNSNNQSTIVYCHIHNTNKETCVICDIVECCCKCSFVELSSDIAISRRNIRNKYNRKKIVSNYF